MNKFHTPRLIITNYSCDEIQGTFTEKKLLHTYDIYADHRETENCSNSTKLWDIMKWTRRFILLKKSTS